MERLPVEILREAEDDATEARAWYAERSEIAPIHFMRDLDRAIGDIAATPERWPVHLHGTRRYRMARFPFLVVYRVLLDRIQVIAVQHGRRRPGYWRERL